MKNKADMGRYKVIPLYDLDIEEYEINKDNIGELLVMQGSKDISERCKVIFSFSKEAMIGFAHEALRLWDNFSESQHIHTEPLGTPLANQSMGFYLTPESSDFIIYCKNYGDLNTYGINKVEDVYKVKSNTNIFKLEYQLDMGFNNDFLQCYNIGFNNVGKIKVIMGDEDITTLCTVIIKLSNSAFLGLGTQLLRLANNLDHKNKYIIEPIGKKNQSCRLGFFLTSNSASMVVHYEHMNNVFYYDKSYGEI